MAQIITTNSGGGSGGGGGGGDGDMKKSVYDPTNVNGDAFDYDNFHNTPTIPTDTSELTNGAGYITGITSGDVNAALGYTPYNSSNPDGYITGISSGDVTAALGYTPYNSTNPSGYVTSSIINDTAYGAGWDADTTHAPTKNAVYDKINSMDTTIGNKANTTDVLTKTNSVSYTPSNDYNPATKKYVDDAIDGLMGLGKFLSLWDCATGQPDSFPLETPYTYTTGDYYLVSTISTATPPVNYKPDGSSYTGTASSTTESDEVAVGDIYIYDGTNWLLQLNHGKSVSFSEIAGSPSDNSALDDALDAKQDALTLPVSPTSGHIVTWGGDNETLQDGGAIPTGDVKKFSFPSVNDDITDLHNWLFQSGTPTGKGAQLVVVGGNYSNYYTVTEASWNTLSDTGEILAEQTTDNGTYCARISYSMPSDTATVTSITTSTSGGNVKAFYMSTDTDTATAQQALDYYLAGGTPILVYQNYAYPLAGVATSGGVIVSLTFKLIFFDVTATNYPNYWYRFTATVTGGDTVSGVTRTTNAYYPMRANDGTTAGYTVKVVSSLPSPPSADIIYLVTN